MPASARPRRNAAIIDSHVHFWDPATREYPWMPEGPLRTRRGPEQLQPLLDANGVRAAVLVQTVSDIEETREFLAIAGATGFVAGVVGWVDLADPHMPVDLAALQAGAHGELLAGIRHQVHDERQPDWLLSDPVQAGLTTLAERGMAYDLLVRTRELPSAITVARDFPHLRFVVDHIAKPPIASGPHSNEFAAWATLMHEFAGLENVACKLSGMVTEATPGAWTTDELRPYVQTVYEIFGPYRLMFGSDWPVCTLAADYGEVLRAAQTVLADLGVTDDEALSSIFGDTARRWYGVEI